MDLKLIYQNRPFKVRNADEYDLENILDLFVDPTDGLSSPFDYENVIIKGKMGSGKTMYLRANHAYYIYTLVHCILNEESIILPIYIKMSDFQTIRDCDKIYSSILIKMLEEMASVHTYLQSAENLIKLHQGFQCLNSGVSEIQNGINKIVEKIKRFTAEEYIETVSKALHTTGQGGNQFFKISSKYSKEKITEIKRKDNPHFNDIIDAYTTILKPFNGKLLILFDEVGSLNRSFFRENEDTSYFESLMNQLRTLPFVRTKIAIYPNSASDVLTETRYGDIVELESSVNEDGYSPFLNRTITLIENYIQKDTHNDLKAEDVFDITSENTEVIEQLIYASNGNMRRLIHLLDLSMNNAYKRNRGIDKVEIIDVMSTLRTQAQKIEALFSASEKDLLSDIVSVCRSRNAFRFSFPNKSVSLIKFTNKSAEYNIINLIEAGTGRKSSIYEFDYAYCIFKDIPTHYIKGSERIDKTRSRKNGDRIKKVTKITDELIEQSVIPGKIEGNISYLNKEKSHGFVMTDDSREYFISSDWVIIDDKIKKFTVGKKIRFVPVKYADAEYAREIEIL